MTSLRVWKISVLIVVVALLWGCGALLLSLKTP